MLRLILQGNSFQFNGKDFLQTHGTAIGTKTAVSSANIFMAKIETAINDQHSTRPLLWKRYIDDVFSLWDTNREEINNFIEHANNYHPTIKFTADISDKEIIFLDTCIYKGARFEKESILDTRTHFKPTETFQYTHFKSCHPPGVKNRLRKRWRPNSTITHTKHYYSGLHKQIKATIRHTNTYDQINWRTIKIAISS